MNGWAKLHREIYDHPFLGKDGIARQLFKEVFGRAAYSDCKQTWRGNIIQLKRGQVMVSIAELAKMLVRTPKEARGALERCKSDGCILVEQPIKRGPCLLTVCNYDKYQGSNEAASNQGHTRGHTRGHTKGTPKGTPEGTHDKPLSSCNKSDNTGFSKSRAHPRAHPRAHEGHTQGHTNKEKNKEINNITPYSPPLSDAPATKNEITASEQMTAALTANQPAPGAKFENGVLTLVNGTRAHWLEQFDNDEENLKLALIQITQYIQPNGYRPLEVQVSSQLARLVREKSERDRRYERARIENQKQPNRQAQSQMSSDEIWFENLKKRYEQEGLMQ